MSSHDTFSASVPKQIIKTDVFIDWYDNYLGGNYRSKVDAMESTIEDNGSIHSVKDLGKGLYERKWKDGLRVYFSTIIEDGIATLLIIGGNKRDQDSDISEARKKLKGFKTVSEVKKII